MSSMLRYGFVSLICAMFIAVPALAETAPLVIAAEIVGDADEGVVARVTVQMPEGVDPSAELQGSIASPSSVIRTFRYSGQPDPKSATTFLQPLPLGRITIDARLVLHEGDKVRVLAKGTLGIEVAAAGHRFVAGERDGAEAILLEGTIPEAAGSIRILPPRRDVAPNLFIVDVETKEPVKKVEFWVDDKKVITRNAPPYRAEFDLGTLPRRVEVRAVGYDAKGRYVDADAFIVNERENPLEVKIARTLTKDGISHVKVRVQTRAEKPVKSVVLLAGSREVIKWTQPPYAIDLAASQLAGVEFLTATVIDAEGTEATDLLFLDGSRFSEQIDVNLVELPVSVVDSSGAARVDLLQSDFTVFENGKPQKISVFGYSSNLPLSLGVLVDHSGSMQTRINEARTAAASFFKAMMREGDQAFFGGFAWESGDLTPFTASVSSLQNEVMTVPPPEGGTALYDAIATGLYRFRSIAGRKALIVVTDGEDTSSRIRYEDLLKYARAAHVPIYFIGVGISVVDFGASSAIRNLAAETGGVAWFIRNTEQLADTYERLGRELRSQYLIGYYAQATKGDEKYRTIEVGVTKPELKVRTVRGYIP